MRFKINIQIMNQACVLLLMIRIFKDVVCIALKRNRFIAYYIKIYWLYTLTTAVFYDRNYRITNNWNFSDSCSQSISIKVFASYACNIILIGSHSISEIIYSTLPTHLIYQANIDISTFNRRALQLFFAVPQQI